MQDALHPTEKTAFLAYPTMSALICHDFAARKRGLPSRCNIAALLREGNVVCRQEYPPANASKLALAGMPSIFAMPENICCNDFQVFINNYKDVIIIYKDVIAIYNDFIRIFAVSLLHGDKALSPCVTARFNILIHIDYGKIHYTEASRGNAR